MWKPSEEITVENHPPCPCCDEGIDWAACECGRYGEAEIEESRLTEEAIDGNL